MLTETTDFIFTSEVAQILQVSEATVRGWERQGRLPALRTARGVRLYVRADVERLARERHTTEDAT